jgi:hypothetical protein
VRCHAPVADARTRRSGISERAGLEPLRGLGRPPCLVPAAYLALSASYRSQDARWAARSSRVRLGDLAGRPLLMNAPCPHCEQISTRGGDAAVAPICPQFGQTIRMSMSVTTAAAGAAARASRFCQQPSGPVGLEGDVLAGGPVPTIPFDYVLPPLTTPRNWSWPLSADSVPLLTMPPKARTAPFSTSTIPKLIMGAPLVALRNLCR